MSINQVTDLHMMGVAPTIDPSDYTYDEDFDCPYCGQKSLFPFDALQCIIIQGNSEHICDGCKKEIRLEIIDMDLIANKA